MNDITFSSGLALGVMTIDTIKETFNVGLDKKSAKAINAKAVELLHSLKDNKSEAAPAADAPAQQAVSAADEILKFKQLLDAGVITQEEFNAKKAQLLGL